MSPQRGIASAYDGALPYLNPICEVQLVSRRNNTAVAKEEAWVDLIDNIGFRDRIDFVHPNDLRISSESHIVASPDDIQMTDSCVVSNRQLFHPKYRIEMTDAYVIVNRALPRINDAESNANAFADLIAEEQTVTGAFQKRREQAN
jgi:hypothetical protein